MFAFICGLIFGIIQMIILSLLLVSATSGDFLKLLIMILIKFALYIVCIGVLLLKFDKYIIAAACGYTAGLPLGAIVYVAFITLNKKFDFRRWFKRTR